VTQVVVFPRLTGKMARSQYMITSKDLMHSNDHMKGNESKGIAAWHPPLGGHTDWYPFTFNISIVTGHSVTHRQQQGYVQSIQERKKMLMIN